jgi:type IV secretory pathway VirJ component
MITARALLTLVVSFAAAPAHPVPAHPAPAHPAHPAPAHPAPAHPRTRAPAHPAPAHPRTRAPAHQDSDTFSAPGLGKVTVYRPSGAPDQVVLFISGDGGWNQGVVAMAERLRSLGALVVGIDIRAFFKSLEAATPCAYPAGVLEEVSRAVQLHYKLRAYRRPILAGYSSGATLVYAAIAAAPPETFAGAISLGFCPDLEIHTPVCQMRGLRTMKKAKGVGFDLAPFAAMTTPWMVLQGDVDQVCAPDGTRAFTSATGGAKLFWLPKVGHGFGVPARWEPQFIEAYRTIAASATPVARPAAVGGASAVDDLNLEEVRATTDAAPGTMAIVLSGDGGWADIDKAVANHLAAGGVPVVGWSSLDYYWTPRTPEQAAADLARIVEHYAGQWRTSRVVVVGYSFGADVAPYLVNRLPEPARSRIASVALLAPSSSASFEFHLASWLGGGSGESLPTAPELAKLWVPTTCIAPEDDDESPCHTAKNPRLHTVEIGTGHHFSGRYMQLAQAVLQSLPPR